MKKIIYTLFSLLSGVTLISCSKDFTETQFFQEKQAQPLTSVEELTSFVNGTYARMRDVNYLGAYYLAYGEVRSDEMYNLQKYGRLVETGDYTLIASKRDPRYTWEHIYRVVANANFIIATSENLTWLRSTDATAIANQVKNLKAQAYAIRGIAFFDLLRLYGQKYVENGTGLGIPIPTVYNPTARSSRPTIEQTENQIETDFAKALELFQDVATYQGVTLDDLVNTSDKTAISPLAVKLYQSRFYLYKENWAQVRTLSLEILNSGKYAIMPSADLLASFVKPSATNSIFELAVGVNGSLGTDSYEYLLNSGGYGDLLLTPAAVALYDNADVRKSLLVEDDGDYYLDNKFPDLKSQTNVKLARVEEVYLNLVEAYLRENDETNALTYYNRLRTQRGLSASANVTFEDFRNEKLRELVGEGFRYWDLLRWSKIDNTFVIPQYNKTGVSDPTKNKTVPNDLFAFPIPQTEIDSPYSDVAQNPGY